MFPPSKISSSATILNDAEFNDTVLPVSSSCLTNLSCVSTGRLFKITFLTLSASFLISLVSFVTETKKSGFV